MNIDYFERSEMSQSKLKELKKSPKHFWAKYIDPLRVPQAETDNMKLGSLFHCRLLEVEKFKSNYIICPMLDKRTKEWKEWKNNHLIELTEKINISEIEVIQVDRMISSLKSKKVTQKIFSMEGLIEQEFYWNDDTTGVPCKMKLDFFIEPCDAVPNGAIIDYKSTQDASIDGFSSSIYKFGYHNQQAFYCSGIKQIYNLNDYPEFYFLAIEKDSPFECGFFEGDDVIMDIGLTENRRLLQLYKQCIESGVWYGYEDKIQRISLPQWAINKHYFNGETK